LSEGDVRLPKLFRVSTRQQNFQDKITRGKWRGGGEGAETSSVHSISETRLPFSRKQAARIQDIQHRSRIRYLSKKKNCEL